LYAIVWCCRPDSAEALQRMSPASFARAINTAFGERLGALSLVGERHIFPLSLKARRNVVEGRTVAIGNAAQALHPVAGQGLNLGLRDAVQLAHSLAPWMADANRPVDQALAAYAAHRKLDRLITGGLTDLLPRVFATGLSPVEHACGLSLLGLDVLSPVRTPLARQLLYGTRA